MPPWQVQHRNEQKNNKEEKIISSNLWLTSGPGLMENTGWCILTLLRFGRMGTATFLSPACGSRWASYSSGCREHVRTWWQPSLRGIRRIQLIVHAPSVVLLCSLSLCSRSSHFVWRAADSSSAMKSSLGRIEHTMSVASILSCSYCNVFVDFIININNEMLSVAKRRFLLILI